MRTLRKETTATEVQCHSEVDVNLRLLARNRVCTVDITHRCHLFPSSTLLAPEIFGEYHASIQPPLGNRLSIRARDPLTATDDGILSAAAPLSTSYDCRTGP